LGAVKNIGSKIIIKIVGGHTHLAISKTHVLFDFDEPIKNMFFVCQESKNILFMGCFVDRNLWVLFNKKKMFVLNNEFSTIGHGVGDFSTRLYIFSNNP